MSTVTFPGLGLAINVREIAFQVFGWPIHWYGVIIALGFLLAVAYCSRKSKDYGIRSDDLLDMLIYAVPLSIIGARLYYVIFYLDLYRRADGSLDFGAMVRIWDGGLAIYGGIIMAVIVCLVFCRVKKLSFLAFADLGSFGLLIGQMVGRWGNFVNVEAFGGPTDLPWRMGIYARAADGVVKYMEVHPTFLYESLWNLVGFLLLALVVSPRRKFDGQIFFSYLGWYGLGRAWIEGLRTDSLYFFNTGLRVSQVLAILSFVGAVVVLVILSRRAHGPLYAERVRAAAQAEETVQAEEAAQAEESAPAQNKLNVEPAAETAEEEKEENHDSDGWKGPGSQD